MIFLCMCRKQRDYDINSQQLHREIIEFCDEISPHQSEEKMRNEVVQRVTSVIQNRWRGTKVKVFGSFVTGLYLPTSDIDIVVCGNCLLYALEMELRSANIAVPGSMQVLSKATVPIIKFEDKETRVKVDISLNESGLKSAEKVKEYLKQYPLLDKMVIVIKQYLYQCHLNEVYSGGIGSYSVILLVVSFFQHCPKCDLENGNLGSLLADFFELYGKKFDYSAHGIRLDEGGSYFDKRFYDNALLIKDPADPTNIIKGAWNIWKVKNAFERAFHELARSLNGINVHHSPILPLIVLIPNHVERYRRWVEENWGRPSSSCGHPLSSRGYQPSCSRPASAFLTHSSNPSFDRKPIYKIPRIYNPQY